MKTSVLFLLAFISLAFGAPAKKETEIDTAEDALDAPKPAEDTAEKMSENESPVDESADGLPDDEEFENFNDDPNEEAVEDEAEEEHTKEDNDESVPVEEEAEDQDTEEDNDESRVEDPSFFNTLAPLGQVASMGGAHRVVRARPIGHSVGGVVGGVGTHPWRIQPKM